MSKLKSRCMLLKQKDIVALLLTSQKLTAVSMPSIAVLPVSKNELQISITNITENITWYIE